MTMRFRITEAGLPMRSGMDTSDGRRCVGNQKVGQSLGRSVLSGRSYWVRASVE